MQDPIKKFVIVGLGNPGKKYERTRHNLGYMVVQALAEEQGWSFNEEKQFHAYVATGRQQQITIALLLPITYMNESGKAVKAYLDYCKAGIQNLVVVSDDIYLDFGSMRLRTYGSPGGHNGLKSIEAALGSNHYARLRIGIGRNAEAKPLPEHVLDTLNKDELARLPEVIKQGVAALKLLMDADIKTVMNRVNARLKKENKNETT